MLWRANLYLDEGANDWNNLNPGTTGNEWNTPDAGYAGIPGGQLVKIPSWTRYYDPGRNVFRNPNQSAQGAAPYTSGGADSPFAIAEELSNQKYVLNQYLIQNGPGGFSWNGVGWSKTTAPSGVWKNYVQTSESNANPSWTLAANAATVTVDGARQYPYRPNLSAIALFGGFQAAGGGAPYWQDPFRFVRESTGVDCSGFIQRAASYSGNRYALIDITQDCSWTADTQIDRLEGPDGIAAKSTLLWEDGEVFPDPTEQPGLIEALRIQTIPLPIVPGDIVVMYFGNFITHVAIVSHIMDPDRDGKFTREDVFFIEAASGHNSTYQVMNNQNLWSYREKEYAKLWRFVFKRLMN